jgi:hypothetical protein
MVPEQIEREIAIEKVWAILTEPDYIQGWTDGLTALRAYAERLAT